MPWRNKVILLVEDSPDDELLILRALKAVNIRNEIIIKRDGAQALDYLFANDSQVPQIILLDLKLPKIDGLEVLRQVRATPKTKTIPVVILTSSKEEKDMLESYNLGVNSYICKPVDFGEFNKAVKELGLYWLLLNEIIQPCKNQ